jgi:DNA-binding transcriptional ArsR family regulator
MGQDASGIERTAGQATPAGGDRPPAGGTDPGDPGRVLELLAHPLRRATLRVLRDAGRVSLDTLARAVMARGDSYVVGDDVSRLDSVTIPLHHVHLPKLADAGVVTYDPEAWAVALAVEDGVLFQMLDDATFDAA